LDSFSEAFFEKHLPLMRGAARNDYSPSRWMAVSFRMAAYFGGGGAKPPPEEPLSRDGSGMDSRDKYQYMEGYL